MLDLKRHPDSRGAEALTIQAEARRPGPGLLSLRYRVGRDVSRLRLPPVTASERAEGLWRHTCFEAFARAPDDEGYHELNFAPSTRWAAYRFSGYRAGMTDAPLEPAPRVSSHTASEGYEIEVTVATGSLLHLPETASWRVAITAVIEDVDGAISYWALAHPPGKPDFHHSDGFVAELTPTDL